MAVLGEGSKITKLPKIHSFSPIPDNKLISTSSKYFICVLNFGQPHSEVPNRKPLATNDNSTPWKVRRESAKPGHLASALGIRGTSDR
jgi:hypothetical protein